jgi:hypothetical protein
MKKKKMGPKTRLYIRQGKQAARDIKKWPLWMQKCLTSKSKE